MEKNIAQIAIIKPLYNLFDYEIPNTYSDIKPGTRVSVEFGKKLTIGFVINIKKHRNIANYKLKPIIEVIDKNPILDHELLNLFLWAANYYHAPIGQIIGLGTPAYLRKGKELLADSNDKKEQKIIPKKKKNQAN